MPEADVENINIENIYILVETSPPAAAVLPRRKRRRIEVEFLESNIVERPRTRTRSKF